MLTQLCPILGRETLADVVDSTRQQWILAQCRETGFVFIANPPQYTSLTDEFAWEKTYQEERSRRMRAEPFFVQVANLVTRIKQLLYPRRNKFFALLSSLAIPHDPLRILDVGCGEGGLMVDICQRYQAVNRRVIPAGIEVSQKLAAISNRRFTRLGGRVIFASAVEALSQSSSGEFDAAIMSSYLEHERDPLELLRRLRPALSAGGAVILKVPNYDCWNRRLRGKRWCGFRFPDHVNYFTPHTLRILAEQAGYRVARQTWWDRFPFSDNMYAVLQPAA